MTVVAGVLVLGLVVGLLVAGVSDSEDAGVIAGLAAYWIAVLVLTGWLVTQAYPPNARRWGAPMAWAILFPPIAIVWMAWLTASKGKWEIERWADTGESPSWVEAKTCPECAETVKAAARVCRFCGYRFSA